LAAMPLIDLRVDCSANVKLFAISQLVYAR
jgi:hypothetical protein